LNRHLITLKDLIGSSTRNAKSVGKRELPSWDDRLVSGVVNGRELEGQGKKHPKPSNFN
jgi:hypothetical protein